MAKMTDAELNTIAFRVKDLLERNGAIRPDEDADVENFLTVPEICERIGLDEGEWIPIQLHMFRLGDSLALMPGRGFYTGTPGEQATIMNYRAKVAKAHLKALAKMLRAVKESGELDNVLPMLREALGDDLNTVPELIKTVGGELDSDLETRLLKAPGGNGHND